MLSSPGGGVSCPSITKSSCSTCKVKHHRSAAVRNQDAVTSKCRACSYRATRDSTTCQLGQKPQSMVFLLHVCIWHLSLSGTRFNKKRKHVDLHYNCDKGQHPEYNLKKCYGTVRKKTTYQKTSTK